MNWRDFSYPILFDEEFFCVDLVKYSNGESHKKIKIVKVHAGKLIDNNNCFLENPIYWMPIPKFPNQ